MSPSAQFPLVAFTTALISIVAFGVARQDVTLLLGAALPAAASWIVTEGPRRRGVPRWVSTLLVLGVLAWTLLEAPLQSDPIGLAGVVGGFVLWTLVIKLYERKSTRDRRQLLGLSVVLMLSGCLVSVDLLFAMLLLGYTVMLIWALMLYRLEHGAERVSERYRTATRLVAPAAVYGNRAGRHLRRVVVMGLAIGAIVSLVLFVLFPRDIMQRFEGWSGARPMTGFRTDIELRTGAPIELSRREVMSVEWIDPGGLATNAPEPLKLRGAVLDRYDPITARWTASRQSRSARPIPVGDEETYSPLGRPPVDERQQTYTQIVEPRLLLTDVIFAAWAPVAVSYPSTGTVLFTGETLELRDPDWERAPRVWRYGVKVQPFVTQDSLMALGGSPSPWREPHFGVPGVAEEARRVLAQVGQRPPDPALLHRDPERRWEWARTASGTFLRYLQGSGFRYTTDLSSLVLRRGEDPIDAFLRRGRSGHCELFASSLCGMLQSVGVEARVVIGFVAVEYDANARRYVVRESNAHAWVEVRTGEWQWSTVDPTPAATLETLADAGRSWADPLRWVYDGIDFLWRTRVVAFDSSAQSSLLRGTGERFTDAIRRLASAVGDWLETLGRQFDAGGIGRIWAISVVVTLAGMISTAVLLSRRERRRRRLLRLDDIPGSERRRVRRDGAFFADALVLLESAGFAKPEWRAPLLHAEWMGTIDRSASDSFTRLTEIYYAMRFGGQPASRPAQTEAAALLRRLEASLRRASHR